MIKKVLNTISTYNLIQKNDHILVGLSGGQDSVFLLYMLTELKKQMNLDLSVAHYNHGVRGRFANRDQQFAKELAASMGYKFYTETGDMEGYAKKMKISDEDAGRTLRREFFFRTMKKIGANKLALGHNYDDQVETILMRILRGTGLEGLSGIQYKSDQIVRPILGVHRWEIEEYIASNNIDYVDDHTNYENDYHRNKIRNILIPMLKEEYNPELDRALYRLGELSRIDQDYLNELAKKELAKLTIKKESKSLILDIKRLLKLDLSIRTRVLRLAFVELRGSTKDISYSNIQEILKLLTSSSGKAIDNIVGYTLRVSFGRLVIEPVGYNTKVDDFLVPLKEGTTNLNGTKITVYQSEMPTEKGISIPIDLIKGSLVLRNRRPKDKIRLPNLNGRKKLKDLFIESKIDKKIRDTYMIVADDETIYWVVGLRKADIPSGSKYLNIEIAGDEQCTKI